MRLSHILIALGIATQAIAAQAYTFPDRGRAGVVDAAHVLPAADLDALNREIVAWDRSTGHQLVVATVPDLQGGYIKDYGYQLGRAWALGDKRHNDGAILLLAMKEHKVRIEVGYGLEPVLTDALTSAILHDNVVQHLRDHDAASALKDGAEAIMRAASPATGDGEQPIRAATEPGFAGWCWALILIGVLFAALGGWLAFWVRRDNRKARERIAAVRAEVNRPLRGDGFVSSAPVARGGGSAARSPSRAPTYVPMPAPSYDSGYRSPSPSPSSDSSASWSSPSFGSSDSSPSSSGFDSGGGSFGGGGSDSSW